MRRTTALLVAAAFLVGIYPATASAHRDGLRHAYKHAYYKVKRELGPRAPGRQIVSHGIRAKGGVRPATKREIARSIRQLRRLLAPPPRPLLVRTAVPPAQPPAGVQTASVRGIGPGGSGSPYVNPDCESNGYGDKRNPVYRGRYQFDRQTWNAYAPAGYAGMDPADAPPAVQDRAAANVPYDAWPNC